MKLDLTLGCGLYDRTLSLQNGSIVPNGVHLDFVPMYPGELFRRQARHAEFDVAEFSMSTYCHLLDEGDRRFVAVPAFISKKFRHSDIYISTKSRIETPEDLVGKRMGAMEYQQTAGVWQRAHLEHDYGVRPNQMEWYFGGYNEPEDYTERVPITLPPDVHATTVSNQKSLDQMLELGEIDALMGPSPPLSFRKGSPAVARLFPNYQEVEAEYFRRSGIFPIMHIVVIKREIYEAVPWVAQSLHQAFNEAKATAIRELPPNNGTLFCMLPWISEHLDEVESIMGPDPFVYGLQENRMVLETFLGYSLEQGLIRQPMTPEDLFVPEAHGDI